MTSVARDILRIPEYSPEREDTVFRGHFGVAMHIFVTLWNLIASSVHEPGAHLKHLLWALLFLKMYSTESVHCGIIGWPDPKMFRKWSWYFVRKMAAPGCTSLEATSSCEIG